MRTSRPDVAFLRVRVPRSALHVAGHRLPLLPSSTIKLTAHQAASMCQQGTEALTMQVVRLGFKDDGKGLEH